jgi:hypothetical protein
VSLSAAVESLISSQDPSPQGDVLAASLRHLARLFDSDELSPGVTAQTSAELMKTMAAFVQVSAPAERPRLGRLRGEEARLVATAIGYPDPESVDVDRFDVLDVIRLRRDRRIAGLPEQPGLQTALDAHTAARSQHATQAVTEE